MLRKVSGWLSQQPQVGLRDRMLRVSGKSGQAK